MATNLTPSSLPACRSCGRGGHFCFVCGRKPKELQEDEGFTHNDFGGICITCIRELLKKLTQHIENHNTGGNYERR